MKVTPRQFFFLIAAVFFLTAAGMIALSLQMPRIGVEFDKSQPADAPLRVLAVEASGPSHHRLKSGDVIQSYVDADGHIAPLRTGLLLTYPGQLLTYDEYNRYIADLDRLYDAASGGVLTLLLADGQRVDVPSIAPYNVYAMPGWWWFRIFRTALIVFLVTGPLAFQHKNSALRRFALAGIASAATGFALLPLEGRELIMSGALMHVLYMSIWGSELVYAGGLLALLWMSPSLLPGHRLTWLLAPIFTCLWIANYLQLGHSMADMQAIPALTAFGLGLGLVVVQWLRTRPKTIERRTVTWFLVFISGGAAWFISLLIVPMLFYQPPIADVQLITLSSLFVFMGLSLGMYRDRLFNVDPWMMSAWLLFASVVVIWVVDLMLVWVLDFGSITSLLISILLVVSLYLPVRHWLWMTLTARREQSVQQLVLKLFDAAMSYDTTLTPARRWQSWLTDAFEPLNIELVSDDVWLDGTVRVVDAGEALHVSALDELPALRLRHARLGGRLFNERDVELCQIMMNWFVRARAMQESRQLGEQAERARMMRDLHDDVVPPLLSLTYQTQGLALNDHIRSLMNNLRAVILTLDRRNPQATPVKRRNLP